ncbi:MAG: transglutaminase-like domain-containing protein [Candidatus Woesearchaeota archaeon]
MFFRKKRKKNVDAAGSEDPLDSLNFSWWTPARKMYGAAIAIASAATIGLWLSSYDARLMRNKTFDAVSDEVIKRYDDYPEADGIDSCLMHDKVVDVVRDSFRIGGGQVTKRNRTIGNRKVSKETMCIRAYDTPQEVDLESRIRIGGLSYWSLSGEIHHSADLRLLPKVPDIFPHEFDISSIRLNGEEMPKKYLISTQVNSISDSKEYSIDIVSLVQDGVISRDDILGDLEVSVSSKLKLDPAKLPSRSDIAESRAYDELSDYFRQYTERSDQFPYDALEMQEIIDGYGGDPGDVLAILEYAMEKTNDSITYYLPELNLNPVDLLYQGKGDCDDYAGLLVTLLRGFGIPSRPAEGDTLVSDGSKVDGYHAWAEILIPLKDGSYHWIMVEPTWSDNKTNPLGYIGYASKQHVYSIDFHAELQTSDSGNIKILEEHNWSSRLQEGVPRFIDVEFMMPKIEKKGEGKR